MKKLIIYTILGYFILTGIFFSGLLIHEGTHILQSKNPTKLCYNFENKNWMEVEHKGYGEEFTAFQGYTEKWAVLIQNIFSYIGVIALTLGIVFIYNRRKK